MMVIDGQKQLSHLINPNFHVNIIRARGQDYISHSILNVLLPFSFNPSFCRIGQTCLMLLLYIPRVAVPFAQLPSLVVPCRALTTFIDKKIPAIWITKFSTHHRTVSDSVKCILIPSD